MDLVILQLPFGPSVQMGPHVHLVQLAPGRLAVLAFLEHPLHHRKKKKKIKEWGKKKDRKISMYDFRASSEFIFEYLSPSSHHAKWQSIAATFMCSVIHIVTSSSGWLYASSQTSCSLAKRHLNGEYHMTKGFTRAPLAGRQRHTEQSLPWHGPSTSPYRNRDTPQVIRAGKLITAASKKEITRMCSDKRLKIEISNNLELSVWTLAREKACTCTDKMPLSWNIQHVFFTLPKYLDQYSCCVTHLLGHFLFRSKYLKAVLIAECRKRPLNIWISTWRWNLYCIAHLLGHFLFWSKFLQVAPAVWKQTPGGIFEKASRLQSKPAWIAIVLPLIITVVYNNKTDGDWLMKYKKLTKNKLIPKLRDILSDLREVTRNGCPKSSDTSETLD